MANLLAYSILDEGQQTSGSDAQRENDWVGDCDASVQHAEAAWNVTAARRPKGECVAGARVLEEAMMPRSVHHRDPIALRRLSLCPGWVDVVCRLEGGGRPGLPLPTVALSSRVQRTQRGSNRGMSWG